MGQAEIVLFGPDERDGVETLTHSKDIARRGLALPLREHPVFDTDALTSERVRPARDVTGSKDAGGAGFEILIDADASINRKTGLLRQGQTWFDAYADYNEISVQPFAALQSHAGRIDRSRSAPQVKPDAMLLVQSPNKVADIGAKDFFNRNGLGPDHLHVDIARAQRRGHLKTDEACTDDNCAPGSLRVGNQRVTVGQSAQVMHLRQAGTGQIEPHRVGTGREQQGVVAVVTAVFEFDLPACNVNACDPRIQPQIDVKFLVEPRRARRHKFGGSRAGEHAL